MKKLMMAALAATTFAAFAAEEAKEKEVEKQEAPIFWGFGNYGIYSGYQLYGSLVNREPTLQGYFEVNANIPSDLGYLGVGVWNNSDLTCQRRSSYGRIFNEFDFNIHWGKTFWFDENKVWGLDYRTSVVWYYYPHHLYQRRDGYYNGRTKNGTATTMDWNHSFALLNPYVVPFVDLVHEYHESDANIVQYGLRRTFSVTDALSLTPSLTFVWRDTDYNWCFPTGFGQYKAGCGTATGKLQLDANYQLTDHIGLFAKVAYCCLTSNDFRYNCDHYLDRDDYGEKKDFAWGGVGLTFNF